MDIGWIHAFAQDRHGFMWFAGEDGLARFDGLQAKIYRHNPLDKHSLGNNYIHRLALDRKGRLWLATYNGLSVYIEESDSFKNYLNSATDATKRVGNRIEDMVATKQGLLLLCTEYGLSIFDPNTEKFKNYQHNPNDPSSLSDDFVMAVFEDSRSRIWAGTKAGVLNLLKPGSNEFIHFKHDPDDSNSINGHEIRDIDEDDQGRIWFVTNGGGIHRMNHDGTFTKYRHDTDDEGSIKSDIVWKIENLNNGQLIFNVDKHGVALYDAKHDKFISVMHDPGNELSLLSNDGSDAFQDRDDNIWIGEGADKLALTHKNRMVFKNYFKNRFDKDSLIHDEVLSFEEDRQGNIWVGSEGGLSRRISNSDKFVSYKHDPTDTKSLRASPVLTIEEDHEGVLWVGTWSGGLHKFDEETQSFYRYENVPDRPDHFPGNYIWKILEDSAKNLWIATERRGLSLYDRSTDAFKNFMHDPQNPDSLSSDHVTSLLEDSAGNLWVGTKTGLNRFDKDKQDFKRFTFDPSDSNSIKSNVVYCLMEDHKGLLWIGTVAGLSIYDPIKNKFSVITAGEGLSSNEILTIIQDNDRNIWVSTQSGISRIHYDSLKIETFDSYDGIRSTNFRRHGILKDSEGFLYFGGNLGYTKFDPKRVRKNAQEPAVIISDFKIHNKKVDIRTELSPLNKSIINTDTLNLSYKDSVISFGFSVLNFRSSRKNRYAYMLQGFDREWTYSKRPAATYTNLDPGNYIFRVKGANNHGVWNEKGDSLAIYIAPPFWRTWWAYSLYLILIVMAIWGIISYYIRLNDLDKERRLNAQLKDLDRTKDRFLANTSHELRTPLNGIIGLTESLLSSEDKTFSEDTRGKLNIVVNSGKRLSNLINDILDYSKLINHDLQIFPATFDPSDKISETFALLEPLLGSKTLKLHNHINPGECLVYADEGRFERVIFNLVGNAIKFTNSGSIEIKCNVDEEKATITVSDTGTGIPEDNLDKIFGAFQQVDDAAKREHNGTGLGLAVVKQQVELHGGKIWVESALGVGSSFIFTLPHCPSETDSLFKNQDRKNVNILYTSVENKNWLNALDIFLLSELYLHRHHIEIGGRHADKKEKILIVDDDNVNRMVLVARLTQAGYQCIEAESGEAAIDIVEQESEIALILLDIIMPGKSGHQTCLVIREKFSRRDLPIIFLTAHSVKDELINSVYFGGNDLMTKPVDGSELVDVIKLHLSLVGEYKILKCRPNDKTDLVSVGVDLQLRDSDVNSDLDPQKYINISESIRLLLNSLCNLIDENYCVIFWQKKNQEFYSDYTVEKDGIKSIDGSIRSSCIHGLIEESILHNRSVAKKLEKNRDSETVELYYSLREPKFLIVSTVLVHGVIEGVVTCSTSCDQAPDENHLRAVQGYSELISAAIEKHNIVQAKQK